MKQLKRGLAFLLVLVMVMGSMGTGVMAAPTAKTGKKAAVKKVAITKPDTKTLVMKKRAEKKYPKQSATNLQMRRL